MMLLAWQQQQKHLLLPKDEDERCGWSLHEFHTHCIEFDSVWWFHRIHTHVHLGWRGLFRVKQVSDQFVKSRKTRTNASPPSNKIPLRSKDEAKFFTSLITCIDSCDDDVFLRESLPEEGFCRASVNFIERQEVLRQEAKIDERTRKKENKESKFCVKSLYTI